MPAPQFFTEAALEEAIALYNAYCPGITEELTSYAKTLNLPIKDIAYTWMTYLIPRCSNLAVLGNQMADGHTKLIRNYEFSLGEEDLAICKTVPKGRYAHIAGTAAVFGRCEGINECGLAVSMSSCGMPVGNMEGMRKPALKGLQFWAVIRSLLENCKDVEEALILAQKMPIAYNINLCLADAHGKAALFETMDGKSAYEQIGPETQRKCLYATNHIVIPDFQKEEPMAMRNSVVRYKKLEKLTKQQKPFTEDQLKTFFLKKYPEGMTAYYYGDWFGTIKSVVMDPIERRFSICWFGQEVNKWEDYKVEDTMTDLQVDKCITTEKAEEGFFEFIKL